VHSEAYHLQMALLAFGMVFALLGILFTLIRARNFSLWHMYGFQIFGIYHVAMFGERRNYATRPFTRDFSND
jgi:hypothetical protein